ncbi:MAG: polysaccharide biosynthesis C-terminal domain-containing protein, partial [Clostridia bacterium]
MNFVFIPLYGYVAAAYTTLASYFVALLLHARYSKKLEKEMYPIKTFLPSIGHVTVASVLFYVLMNKPITRWFVAIIYVLI